MRNSRSRHLPATPSAACVSSRRSRKASRTKRQSLETALAAYKAAADYKVADVATQATFEMAELYRTLARDLMESERPKNLQGDALEQYSLLLEEQAFPFEEQAIAVHEANAARAKEGVYNDGVKASYAALAQLNPGRYGKTELPLDVVASLTALEPRAPEEAAPADMATGGAPAKKGGPPIAAPPPPPPAPARAVADFDRAVGLARAGDTAGAALEFGQLSAAVPQYAAVFYNLGVVERKASRLAESEAALRAALERNPASAMIATELGLTLRLAGKFSDARAAYEQALAADETLSAAHRNYAVLLDLYLFEPAPALAQLERYKELTGEDKPVTGWIAELRQRAGKVEPVADTQPSGAGP
jgi:tetratricopeptide (TPR) repeat protein